MVDTQTDITGRETLQEIKQIRLQLAQILQDKSSKGIVEAIGSDQIDYVSNITTQHVVQLNPKYYHDVVIKLLSSTSTNTFVYLNTLTAQDQMPTKIRLNSTVTKIRLKGIRVTNITSDASLTSGQSLYVYYIGYEHPQKADVDV